MNTIGDGLVVLLPTFLAVVAMWVQPPRKKHPTKWRVGLIFFGLLISALTFRQLYQQEKKSEGSASRAEKMEHMLQVADDGQRATQRRLDESIQREQRINDQNNDLRTDLRAQNELLQILKNYLPPDARKKADSIHKHWNRELFESIHVQDKVAATPPAK
jgi:hypothetical protein